MADTTHHRETPEDTPQKTRRATGQATTGQQTERAPSQAYRAGQGVAHNRWVLLILGVATVIAGTIALAMPFLASITAALLMGWVLVFSGAIGLVSAFRRSERRAIAAAFALALLSIVAGVLLLLQPIAGLLALTTILIAYFAAAGVLRLIYGARALGEGGGWVMATGALSAVLAVLLFFGLPFSAAWVPGVLLGIDLILWGAVEIALGLREGGARRQDGDEAA